MVALATNEVDFAVVGGLAVIFNGYDRLTLDADILVKPSPENIRKLLHTLSTWGEGRARELTTEDFAPQEGSIRVMEDFDLDIFTQMRGNSLDDFRPPLRQLQTGGVLTSTFGIFHLASRRTARTKKPAEDSSKSSWPCSSHSCSSPLTTGLSAKAESSETRKVSRISLSLRTPVVAGAKWSGR